MVSLGQRDQRPLRHFLGWGHQVDGRAARSDPTHKFPVSGFSSHHSKPLSGRCGRVSVGKPDHRTASEHCLGAGERPLALDK